MLQFRMGVHPGFEVVGFECLELIVFEVDEIVTIGDAAFGDMSAKLAAKHTVQFAGGEVGIVLQHGIDELVQAVQTLCLWLELQEVFQLQYVATFENGLVLMVDDGIAVGLVLGAMKDQIDTKLLLHQLAKLFFVGSHIAVLQENGTELFPSALIGFKGLQVLLDGGQQQGVDDVAIALDAEIAVFLVAFVAAGFEDGTELIEGVKLVVESILDGLRCSLLLILAHDAVDDFLRMYPLVMVVNLMAIGGHSAGHYMKMVVVGVVVGIDEKGLTFFAITHFFEILVGNVQKLLVGVFIATAGDGEMELG